ncbi:MAG: ornithine carbamoyltransferase [Dehalococcoidia bacterium]
MSNKRDFLSIADFSPQETRQVVDRSLQMKAEDSLQSLWGKHVALLFEKPSLRTKVSFQVGVQELGGYSLYLGPQEVGLGTREPVSDVARVLSGYVDCIVARVNSHESLAELAHYASVPVINALSDLEHPCQIMADLLTIAEHQGELGGLKLAYVGDGNNVARSLSLALPAVGMNFAIASPEGYNLDETSLQQARERSYNGAVEVLSVRDPVKAVKGADVVYTDVWTSMGDEAETAIRLQAFQGYTVDPELLSHAKPTARFMHDMPAHYGEEVPPGMLEHPQSVAYDQAHNRLHAQKAIMEFLLDGH